MRSFITPLRFTNISHWLLSKTPRFFLSLPIAEKESVRQTCFLRQCTCCFLKAHGIRFLCTTKVFGTDDPYPTFRSFCLEYDEEIRSLISARLVQTNEVRRCIAI